MPKDLVRTLSCEYFFPHISLSLAHYLWRARSLSVSVLNCFFKKKLIRLYLSNNKIGFSAHPAPTYTSVQAPLRRPHGAPRVLTLTAEIGRGERDNVPLFGINGRRTSRSGGVAVTALAGGGANLGHS